MINIKLNTVTGPYTAERGLTTFQNLPRIKVNPYKNPQIDPPYREIRYYREPRALFRGKVPRNKV